MRHGLRQPLSAKPENDRGKEKTRRDVMDRYYKKKICTVSASGPDFVFVMVIVIPFIMGVIYSFTAGEVPTLQAVIISGKRLLASTTMLRHLKPKNSLMRLYIPLR